MTLDHHTTRILADRGADWTAPVSMLAGRLPRWSRRASALAPLAGLRHGTVRAFIGTAGMAICATLCLAGVAAPAEADTVRSKAVSYADLDLSRVEGRAVLDTRIRAAARAVCEVSALGLVQRWERIDAQRCYREAIADASLPAAKLADID